MTAFLPGQPLSGVLADQLAGLEVVGRVGDVGGLHRVERGVQGDHEEAVGLRLAQRRVHGRSVGGDQDALVAARDRGVDRVDLRLGVAVGVAGGDREVRPGLLRLDLGGLLHGDEVGVGLRLDDQRDAGLVAVAPAARQEGQQEAAGHGREETPSGRRLAAVVLGHPNLPERRFRSRPTGPRSATPARHQRVALPTPAQGQRHAGDGDQGPADGLASRAGGWTVRLPSVASRTSPTRSIAVSVRRG